MNGCGVSNPSESGLRHGALRMTIFSTPKYTYIPCLSPCSVNRLTRTGSRKEGITHKLRKLCDAGVTSNAQNTPSLATLSLFKLKASDFEQVAQTLSDCVSSCGHLESYWHLISRVLLSAHHRVLQNFKGSWVHWEWSNSINNGVSHIIHDIDTCNNKFELMRFLH